MKRNWSALKGYLLGTFSPAAAYLLLINAGCTNAEIVNNLGYAMIVAGCAFMILGLIPAIMMFSCIVQRKHDFFDWRGHRLEWSILTVAMMYVIGPATTFSGVALCKML